MATYNALTNAFTLEASEENFALPAFIPSTTTPLPPNAAIYGNALANKLTGDATNNLIDGGGGDDIIYVGSGGNDDIRGGEGNDWVDYSSATVRIVLSLETGRGWDGALGDTFSGIENIRGSAKDDDLHGNDANNYLEGLDGHDALWGGGGNDTLEGGLGDDYFRGGTGNDLLIGGLGNDFYFIDSLGDIVIETADGGTRDQVVTSIDIDLSKVSEHVEWMSTLGEGALTLIGNAHNNIITGNTNTNTLVGGAGNDTLNGSFGADRMEGGTGNDVYYVDHVNDKVIEASSGGKADTVRAFINYTLADNVENLEAGGAGQQTLTGNKLNNAIRGGFLVDKLYGGAGNDTLDGGSGNDVLHGGTGKDSFFFSQPLSKGKNVDTIKDFSVKDDTIRLENAVFTKLTKTGQLNKGFFTIGSKAKDKNDYLVYDNKKGVLYYDADGSGKGKAVEFAKIGKGLKMTYADFFIV
ncbi:hypothetical protein MHY87_17210 [Microvirga sp. ACRRW]|uniref:calcium-binding protein n=1 Tax=Microvirga sp. ACRRW TaxID=2918205 RepID=UPI001EF5F866|nr:calcium-binding protein [Microvirga sp. ACRRW]MCG7394646.1 hypothetical protein [Microvirga sp. ACRRW]